MQRRTLLRLTLANTVLLMLVFVAVPLPPGLERKPAPLPVQAREPSVFDAAVSGLGSDDADERRTSVRVLGALGDRRAVAHLGAMRGDRDGGVAREATLALARLTGDPAIVHELVARADEDPSAAAAIGACPSPTAEEELVALSGPRDPFVRGAALKALAARAPTRAVPLLADALASGDAPLRFLALEAALFAPDPSLVPKLRELASSDDRLERRAALTALARTGDAGAVESLVEMGETARAAGDPWVEILAAESLVRAGASQGAPMWRRAASEMLPVDRAAAISRFRDGFPDAIRPDLRSHLTDGDPGVRVAAALVLGIAGDRAASDVLRRDGAATPDAARECAVVLAALASR